MLLGSSIVTSDLSNMYTIDPGVEPARRQFPLYGQLVSFVVGSGVYQ